MVSPCLSVCLSLSLLLYGPGCIGLGAHPKAILPHLNQLHRQRPSFQDHVLALWVGVRAGTLSAPYADSFEGVSVSPNFTEPPEGDRTHSRSHSYKAGFELLFDKGSLSCQPPAASRGTGMGTSRMAQGTLRCSGLPKWTRVLGFAWWEIR